MSKFQELPTVRQPEILRQSLFKFYGIFSIGRIVIKMELSFSIFILGANLADYYEFNSFQRTNFINKHLAPLVNPPVHQHFTLSFTIF